MKIYLCLLDEGELAELDTLLEELTTLSIWFVEESEYDSWLEARMVASEVIELIRRGEEVRGLLFRDEPISENLLLDLVDDLQLLTEMADILRNLGYTGTFRLKRRAKRMIEILGESCIEIA